MATTQCEHPFLSDFRETVLIKNVPDMLETARIFMEHRSSETAILRRMSSLCHRNRRIWRGRASVRAAELKSEFPAGVCGLRARFSNDPSAMKQSICGKQTVDDSTILGTRATRYHGSYVSESPAPLEGVVAHFIETPVDKRAVIPDLHMHGACSFFDSTRKVNVNQNSLLERVSVWTPGEVRVFLERFQAHRKSFKRISQYLTDKSEADVIDFYYRYKIPLNLRSAGSSGDYRKVRYVSKTLESPWKDHSPLSFLCSDHYKSFAVTAAKEESGQRLSNHDPDLRKIQIECINVVQGCIPSLLPFSGRSSDTIVTMAPNRPFAIPLGNE